MARPTKTLAAMQHLARTRHDWTKCTECREPLIRETAVGYLGGLYHPTSCFPKVLKRITDALGSAIGGSAVVRGARGAK